MKRTIQRTLGDDVANDTEDRIAPLSIREIILIAVFYLISKFDFQRVLYLLSFLTYGVADGLTASYLMAKKGLISEVNPIAKFMYASSGWKGVLFIKVWFAYVILFMVWVISRRGDSYWMINGFLLALGIGGIMASRANIMAANGMVTPSPGSIIITFLFLIVLFIMIGDLIDKLKASKALKYSNAG